jgi:rare lipoprotein A
MRKTVAVCGILLGVSLALGGCSWDKPRKLDPFAGVGSPYYKGAGEIPAGGGRYHVGKPYEVAGRWFTPKEQPNYDESGPASWYGEAFHRRMTSNGEWFDMNDLTAAHPTLPLPSYAKVTNLENGAMVVVRINDRGPFVGPRIIDLSKRTAMALGFLRQGKADVRVQYIGPAPLNDNGSHLMAMNRELERGTALKQMIAAVDTNRPAEFQAASVEPQEPEIYAAVAPASPANYFIQAGLFSNISNAERIGRKLSQMGDVQILPLEGSTGDLFRVRVGPWIHEEDAEMALNQVYELGLPDAHVVKDALRRVALQ